MLAGFHSRILMLGIECCMIITRAEIVSPQGRVYISTKSLYMGETDGLIFLFCSWSVLIVSEWVVLAWSRCLIWSRLKWHLSCSKFIQGWEEQGQSKMSSFCF